MQVNQIILGCIHEGQASNPGDKNPYKESDKKRHAGWQRGYEMAREEEAHDDRIEALPWWRQMLCFLGFHSYVFTMRCAGAPKLDKDSNIVGRYSGTKKYECKHCGDVMHQLLGNDTPERAAKQRMIRDRNRYYNRRRRY